MTDSSRPQSSKLFQAARHLAASMVPLAALAQALSRRCGPVSAACRGPGRVKRSRSSSEALPPAAAVSVILLIAHLRTDSVRHMSVTAATQGSQRHLMTHSGTTARRPRDRENPAHGPYPQPAVSQSWFRRPNLNWRPPRPRSDASLKQGTQYRRTRRPTTLRDRQPRCRRSGHPAGQQPDLPTRWQFLHAPSAGPCGRILPEARHAATSREQRRG